MATAMARRQGKKGLSGPSELERLDGAGLAERGPKTRRILPSPRRAVTLLGAEILALLLNRLSRASSSTGFEALVAGRRGSRRGSRVEMESLAPVPDVEDGVTGQMMPIRWTRLASSEVLERGRGVVGAVEVWARERGASGGGGAKTRETRHLDALRASGKVGIDGGAGGIAGAVAGDGVALSKMAGLDARRVVESRKEKKTKSPRASKQANVSGAPSGCALEAIIVAVVAVVWVMAMLLAMGVAILMAMGMIDAFAAKGTGSSRQEKAVRPTITITRKRTVVAAKARKREGARDEEVPIAPVAAPL
ncbi:hypothetical protein QBC39DRAFT_437804 [Podospora conica]|nr:hypothetical protein QBC39DRAFT_437804 [Schizothecium conicum]